MGRADSWDKILSTPVAGCSWLEFTPADASCRYWPELQPARSERQGACDSNEGSGYAWKCGRVCG